MCHQSFSSQLFFLFILFSQETEEQQTLSADEAPTNQLLNFCDHFQQSINFTSAVSATMQLLGWQPIPNIIDNAASSKKAVKNSE
jgi:hypothetical protein